MTTTDAAQAPRPWWLLDVTAAIVLPMLVVGMFVQKLGAYLAFGGTTLVPTAGQVTAYWITAGIALALGFGGFVAAMARGNGWAIGGYLAMGVLVLPAVLLFAVPNIDFGSGRDQTPEPLGSNYCGRTDSENCPGG